MEANITNGCQFFSGDPTVSFIHGDILEPLAISPLVNIALSANTLPHLPSIEPVVSNILKSNISICAFRMLIGSDIVISKKLVGSATGFESLSTAVYQHNNIYSLDYIKSLFGPSWRISVHQDFQDLDRLEKHQQDVAYASAADSYSRVSRPVGNLVFKGDLYMPWKILLLSKENA
ncbi:hypothetical protein [Synechococcus lacustris]|uniref:hypothetical protein n=1 Tax=Synechococcus lacustris TaxID=2116544 RepID=UPI0019D47132|nr:hypothetical protein [Synechococcus lacustris]